MGLTPVKAELKRKSILLAESSSPLNSTPPHVTAELCTATDKVNSEICADKSPSKSCFLRNLPSYKADPPGTDQVPSWIPVKEESATSEELCALKTIQWRLTAVSLYRLRPSSDS